MKTRQTTETAQHYRIPNYKVGDRVRVSRKLLTDAYTKARPSANLIARRFGPFEITALAGKNALELAL